LEGFFLAAYLYTMAGIFKNLDKSDVRLTPFRAHKLFSGPSAYTTYSAVINIEPEDIGNNQVINESGSLFTTYYVSKNSVWNSIDSQFYRYYNSNPKASFGQLDLIRQPRQLSTEALVFSLPQNQFGEGVEKLTTTFTVNGIVYEEDLYGNIVKQSNRWTPNGEISASNVVFALKPANYTKQLTQTLSQQYNYPTDRYQAVVEFNNMLVTSSMFETELRTNRTLYATSSIVIRPNGEKINNLFNFQTKDYSIVMSFATSSNSTSSLLLEKNSRFEQSRVDLNGNVVTDVVNRYPYRLSHLTASNVILFEKTSGASRIRETSSFTYDQTMPLALSRSGSIFTLYNGANTSSFSDTLFANDKYCANKSNIYIGANEFGVSGSTVEFGNVTFLDTALNQNQYNNLTSSIAYNNVYQTVGNIARKQGLVIITDRQLVRDIQTYGVSSFEYRGTLTTYENEISCTISPGEFLFSNNPTLHEYNPITDQVQLQGFATASSFRPYVSRVGLYDDNNHLLIIGSLSQPIQLPQNVDTTLIVRYDIQ
jgi:hypothetical protein